jgi:hypothetical protein
MIEAFFFRQRKAILFLFIPLLSLCMHWHIFKTDLVGYHVWRQTQTQNTILSFYREDFNILKPRISNRGNGSGIFRMEFPIMQWGIACFYKIFGDHLIITRILSFIIGLFSIWGIYLLLYNIFKIHRLALFGAWCFNFSPVFYYYTLNPMPDNLALCLSIYGMAFFFKWIENPEYVYAIWSAAFISLSVLSKMPFVVYIGGIVVYLLMNIRKIGINSFIKIGLIFFAILFLPALWYVKVVGTWQGNGIVTGVLSAGKQDISNLLDILQGNLISILPELLINYGSLLFFFAGFFLLFSSKKYRHPLFPLFFGWGISVLLYFLFEMNMINTVHDYYMFPFLPLIFIIVGYGAEKLISHPKKILRIVSVAALCILPITAFLRADHRWNTIDPGFNANLLTYKNDLQNILPDNKLCVVGNDESSCIWFYYINKKGWAFDNDWLDEKSLKEMISQGAAYLYTDSKKVQQDTGIKSCIDRLILQRGDVCVYALKQATLQY